MSTTIISYAGKTARRTAQVLALGFIGVLVGFSCVLLPPSAPFLILAPVAVTLLWVTPTLRAVPRALASAMLAPFLLITISVPSFYGIILPNVPYITIKRAIVFAWVIVFAIALAGSPQARSYVIKCFRPHRVLTALLVAYCVSMIVSTITATSVLAAFSYNINLVINNLLPMLVIVYVVRDEDRIITCFKIAIVGVAIDLFIGIAESRLHHPFLVYLLPSRMINQLLTVNPQAAKSLIDGFPSRNGMYRASSIFSTPLSWGEMSAMLAPFCAHFLGHGKSMLQRSYGAVGMCMTALSIFLSGSRGAYVGFLAALIVYAMVWSLRSIRNHRESMAGTIWLVFLGFLSTSVVASVLFIGRIRRTVLGGGQAQGSTDARAEQWALAKPKILARPFTGYGGGSAGDVINWQTPGGAPSVDGYYMNLLVDYGLIGCISFFCIFIAAAYICFRGYTSSKSPEGSTGAAIGAGIVAFTLYRLTLSQVESLTIAFVLVGLALAYHQGLARSKSMSKPQAAGPLLKQA